MGDYTKLWVNAEVSVPLKELEAAIEEALPIVDSAYHCQGSVVQVTPSGFGKEPEDPESHNVIIVCQTKWGQGQREFLEWLKPRVTQGSGEKEIFAIQFYEEGAPIVWKMPRERNEEAQA